MQQNSLTAWLSAFRLRTLPLAFSCILAGSAVAVFSGHWDTQIFILALLTTLFLQILSNLANDFGDSANGADNEGRIGPARTVQAGHISHGAMKKAIVICGLLALGSGIALIWSAFGAEALIEALLFLALGLLAIMAAIKYTVGSSPYGYRGLGDVFVFLFFGLVGVIGVYFLFANNWNSVAILPAISIGAWSTAVLNLNNLRDHENDAKSGKRTLVVKMGFERAKKYHYLLILLGWVAAIALISFQNSWFLISLLPLPLHLVHMAKVSRTAEPRDLDPELKKIALSTFLYALIVFVVAILSTSWLTLARLTGTKLTIPWQLPDLQVLILQLVYRD